MKCWRVAFLAVLLGTCAVDSAQTTRQSAEFPLWPRGAPGARGNAPADVPTLSPFLTPATQPTAAVIILPGGGYAHLSDHEGAGYAQFLSARGMNCFVLKYRLGSAGYRHPAMLEDAARAVRIVRAGAGAWNIDPHKIVIMGSSAGGHLAATLMTHFDAGLQNASDPIERQSSRPDFGVLCYAVITMGDATHAGSRQNLLGDNPDAALVEALSAQKQVTDQTPPCFIWAGRDDKAVPVENSLSFAAALATHNVPYELHIYQHAPHGIGLGDRTPPFVHALPWTTDLLAWFKTNQLD